MSVSKLRIGLDIDGVCADFVRPYVYLLNSRTGKNADPLSAADRWKFEEKAGFTREEVETTWDWLASQDAATWWATLPRLMNWKEAAIVREWHNREDLYFITSRPPLTRNISQNWVERYVLEKQIYDHGATVLLSRKKGHIANGLALDAIIDDKVRNLEDVLKVCGTTCRVMLYNQPWNQESVHPKIERIYSLHDAFDKLNKVGV